MGSYNAGPLITESVSAVTGTPSVELGTRRWVDGREYTYVYNGAAANAIAPGYCCVLTGTSGYTVAVTYASLATTAVTPTVFGVVREATITTTAYGWVVTNGFCDLYNDGTAAVAAGDFLMPSLDGTVRTFSAVCVITNLIYNWGGNYMKAMQATTTAGTFGAYVRLG